MVTVEAKIQPQQTQVDDFLRMAVLNTVSGVRIGLFLYLQNIKLIAPDSLSTPITVPYDFDHAGIVNAPYAQPAEELQMSSIRQRRYRGYCMPDLKAFDGHYCKI